MLNLPQPLPPPNPSPPDQGAQKDFAQTCAPCAPSLAAPENALLSNLTPAAAGRSVTYAGEPQRSMSGLT